MCISLQGSLRVSPFESGRLGQKKENQECHRDCCDSRTVQCQVYAAVCGTLRPRRLNESVGGVFDPVGSSAVAVFEHPQ